MTANRPRRVFSADEVTLTEAVFSGASGWVVGRYTRLWRPPTDVYETEDQIIVQVEIAGMRQDDFYIAFRERRLLIGGVRPQTRSEPRAYHQMQIDFGEFRTEVELPAPVEADAVTAEYEAGFLRITLPKQKPQQPDAR
jgi:HSP20 family molecular chaperone IbpA